MTRQGIASADSSKDPRRAVNALVELEKYLDDNSEAFTPVQNAVAARVLRESSQKFKAADVTRHLEQGKTAVAAIDNKRKSVRPKAP